ncbi:MAG: TaqI-like C-terminal specificity domain-containing protein, partial [Xanthobacteraceae bacterium]
MGPSRYIKKSYTKPIIEESRWQRLPPKRLAEAQTPKIVVGGMNKTLECLVDDGKLVAGKSTTIVFNTAYPLNYVLGVLNSKLITFFFQRRFSGLALQGGFFRMGPPQLQHLPIPDPRKFAKDSRRLEQYVDEMIKLQEALWSARTPHERDVLE